MADRNDETRQNENDESGLPLDPDRRRAAVPAHFDAYFAQVADLSVPTPSPREENMPDRESPVDLYRRELARVEGDLVNVLRHHARTVGAPMLTIALVEVLGGVCKDIIAANPGMRPRITEALDQLQLYLTPSKTWRAQ